MKKLKELPVYLINGFLEAGKTDFLKFTISQDYFQIDETTLLIVCEEGELEYEEELLKSTHTVMEVIDEEEEFNPEKLMILEDKYKPERVVVEYNGMWNMRNLTMPAHWQLTQQITIVDGTTFPVYFNNMKSLFLEMVKQSEMILFNRCKETDDFAAIQQNIKLVNSQAQIVFEDENGDILEVEEELPYDVEAPKIILEDEMYPIWYMDAFDHEQRYAGKVVEFDAMVLKPTDFPSDRFVPGRMVMTCCAQDTSFLGFVCKWSGARQLKNRQWIHVTAQIGYDYWKDYDGRGPILYAQKVEPIKKPARPVIGG